MTGRYTLYTIYFTDRACATAYTLPMVRKIVNGEIDVASGSPDNVERVTWQVRERVGEGTDAVVYELTPQNTLALEDLIGEAK